MQRYALLVAYDGTNYKGFQIQINGITVQEKIEMGIFKITGENCRIMCAGRTDSGVHACGQVVSFSTEKNHLSENLLRALNAVLPYDIRILACSSVGEVFNPRQDALRKTYSYVINNTRISDPFMVKKAWHVPWALQPEKLKEIANVFCGYHDFQAFSASGCSARTFHREIYKVDLDFKDSFVVFHFTANGFLYNMVRILMGTAVDYATDKLTLKDVKEALAGEKTRNALGQTAPAHGLYMRSVEYATDIFPQAMTNRFFMW